jgi:F420-dependent oxidoreductase-like protein
MNERTALVAFWKKFDRKQVLRYAQMADEMGYDSFWIPEAWGYEAFSVLTEIAVHTKNLKVGTGIVNVFSRSPSLMAMQAATLDEISEGRLILGLGTSGKNVVEGFHGVDYKKPLTRLRQYIMAIQALLRGERLSDAGADLWDFRPFALEMTPVRDRIPIFCACLNDKAIKMIGELADGWIPTFWPYDKLHLGRELIAEGAKRSGRNPDEVVISPFTTVIPFGKEIAHGTARGIISFYIGGMGDYYHAALSRMGFAENADVVRDLYQSKQRKEAAAAVSEELLEALTIGGDPDFCRTRLGEWRENGVGLPILNLPTDLGPEICGSYLETMKPAS